jgi:hypothetical protein
MVGEAEPKARESRGEEQETTKCNEDVKVTTEGDAPVEYANRHDELHKKYGDIFGY